MTTASSGGFDQARYFMDMSQAQRLQVSRQEMTWVQNYRPPDRPVEVVVSLSCGMQSVPHLMVVLVTLMRLLGIDFVATAGAQFCCGKPFQRAGAKTGVGDRTAATSIRRFASWSPTTNVQCCGSCFVEFSGHVEAMRATGAAPFEVVHVTRFILDALRRIGDAVPWRRPIPRRVLLHAEGAQVHPSKEVQRADVIETLGLVPGVEYAGLVRDPAAGAPCANGPDGEASVLANLTPAQYRRVLAELWAQADAVGADAILTHHHKCHREWSKFSSRRLPVVYYPALITEALGVAVPDRFQQLWQLGDAQLVLAQTRACWSSWGIAEPEAREMVRKFFEPRYAAAIQRCPCEGDCLSAGRPDGADPACAAAAGVLGG